MSVLSVAAAWWLGLNAWRTPALPLQWSSHLLAIAVGLLATLPLIGLLIVFEHWPPRSLAKLRQSVDKQIVPLLKGHSLAQFAVLALCAGVGEELLFRGLLQTWLEQWLPDIMPGGRIVTSILIAGVIFGACHWINDQYALMAAIVGMYLGAVFVLSNHLLAPMTAHAAYDFFALWYLVLYRQRQASVATESSRPLPPDSE